MFDVELGEVYLTRSGYECMPLVFARHSQDCSICEVVYEMLENTFDSPAHSFWVMEEQMFLKIMRKKD